MPKLDAQSALLMVARRLRGPDPTKGNGHDDAISGGLSAFRSTGGDRHLDRLARRLHVEPRDLLLFPEHDPVAAAHDGQESGTPRMCRMVAVVNKLRVCFVTASAASASWKCALRECVSQFTNCHVALADDFKSWRRAFWLGPARTISAIASAHPAKSDCFTSATEGGGAIAS